MTSPGAMSKDALRQAMPTVAAIVDEYRQWMTGGKVIYASENGHVIDRREPVDESKVFTIPRNYGNHSGRDHHAQRPATKQSANH